MSRRILTALLVLSLLVSVPGLPASAQDGGTANGGTAAQITLSADPHDIQSGGASTLTAAVYDAGGQPVPGVEVDFTASAGQVDPPSATTGADGRVTAAYAAPQTSDDLDVSVSAQVYGTQLAASAWVAVHASRPSGGQQPSTEAPTLTGITVQPAQAAVAVGGTVQLSVTAQYSDGSTTDVTAQAGYASSDPSVAAISASGLVTAVAPGTVTVTATYQGQSAVASVTVQAQQPQQPEQPAPLKVVEVTPAPGSDIDPDAEVRVKFDRPVVVARSELAAYNLNGCGVSYEWGEVDPADPTVVKLEKPCGFPTGQITLAGIPASSDPVVKGRDDGALLVENTPQITYTVRPKAPAVVRFAPEPGTRADLHLVSTVGGGYLGYARPDQVQPAVDFDVPVQIADPAKVQLVVRTPLYERTFTSKTDPAGQGGFLINSVGQRIALQENYSSLSVIGPAFQGILSLRFLPGAVRHFGSQDAANVDTIELTVEVNPPIADGVYVPGSPPPQTEAKALASPELVWEAPLPHGDGRVRGVARTAGGVVVSSASGMAAYKEGDGSVLWQVDGWFSATAVGPDGGVYAVRGDDQGNFYLERYNPDGTLSWSRYLPGDLVVVGEVPAPPQVLPDGDVIYAVGDSAAGLGSGSALVVWRVSSDGTLKGAWDLTGELGGSAAWANASCKLVTWGYKAVLATGNNVAVVDFSGPEPRVLGKTPIQVGALVGNVVCLHADDTGFYAAQDVGLSGVTLYAFSPDGSPGWSCQLPNPLGNRGYVVVAGGKMYYAGYTVDLATGAYEETRLPLSPGGAAERVQVLAACSDDTLIYTGASYTGAEELCFAKDGAVGAYGLSTLRGKMTRTAVVASAAYAPPVAFGSLYLPVEDDATLGALLLKLDEAQQPPQPVSLRVDPPEATVKVGESAQYRAVTVYSDGSEKDVTAEAAWSVSDTSVAGIDAGLATGLKAGQTDVTATWQGLTGNAKLTVVEGANPPAPLRLEVRPAEATVEVGETAQYRAFVIYSDGTERDVTEEAAWSVSDPSVASVTTEGQDRGLATGLKPGRVDVTATWEAR